MKAVHWMLITVLVLPASVYAQQDNASHDQKPQGQVQSEAAPTKSEENQKPAEETQAKAEKDQKVISGMSILGNQEAPKSLVIVPWKSSELGGSIGISTMLDDSKQPVDKDVFTRALHYYEIRSDNAHQNVVPAASNAAPAAAAAIRRKK